MPELPTVTALMPAFNGEAFVEEALRSALTQAYPPELLDVVVVDDGSTDATAAIVARVAAEAPGRVRLVRQENRGLVGAVNRAVEEADGELLALLDADDAWPPGKTDAQVQLLRERPEVGLVYTDMVVVDAAGDVLRASWLADAVPPRGRGVGPFLGENLVTASSIMVRAALRGELFPIPAELPWADWWLAVRAAQISEVAYLPVPRTRYRFHGNNMSLGSSGARRLRELRGALALQRHVLRRLEAPDASVADLELGWQGFERMAAETLAAGGSPFTRLLDVDEAERAEAVQLAGESAALLDAGDVHGALAAAVRAAATDPGGDEARGAVLTARAHVPDGLGPRPLEGARARVLGVDAGELLEDPSLLAAYAQQAAALADVTLAIDAAALDPAEAHARIAPLVAQAGLDGDGPGDVLLVTGPLDLLGRARLEAGLSAVLSARGAGPPGVPVLAPDELGRLHP